MPLQKRLFPVVLGPLDQKSDSKTAIHGRVTSAKNCYREKTGEYRKRFGRTELGSVGIPSGTLNSIWQLAAYRDALVSLGKTGAGAIWGFNETSGKWTAPGTATTFGIRSRQRVQVISKRFPVPMASGANYTPDCAVLGDTNYAVMVWDKGGSVMECVYDLAKGTIITINNLGTGGHPRVELVSSDKICVVYRVGSEIAIREWNASACSAGTVLLTYVTSGLLADTTQGGKFDVVAQDSKLSVAVLTTTPEVRVLQYTPTTQAVVDTAPYAIGAGVVRAIGFLKNSAGATNRRVYATCDATAGLVVHVIDVSGAIVASYIMDTSATCKLTCRAITGHTTTTAAAGVFNVVYEVAAPDVTKEIFDCTIRIGGRTAAGVLTTDVTVAIVWSLGLRSKTFRHGSDYYYLATYNSLIQPAYFLMRVPLDVTSADTSAVSDCRVPHMKLLKDRANGGTADPFSGTEAQSSLTNVIAHGTNKWALAVPRQSFVSIQGGDAVPRNVETQVDIVELEFDPSTRAGRPTEAADSLLVPAGQLMAFDGTHYNECGTALGPETPQTPTQSNTAAGALTLLGVYNVILVYKYTDSKGRTYRSAPSPALTTPVTMTGANDTLTVNCPTLRIYGDERAADPSVMIEIEVYRTTNAGTIYYLDGSVTNVLSADTVTYTCEVADTTLAGATQLYTTGEVLENISPPQFKAIAYWHDRVWGIDADFPNRLWYSKVIEAGKGPEFSDAFVLELDDEWGDCTALAGMDDKLVVFKRDAIYALNGDGPDNLGRGLYTTPQRVANGVGATHQRSVVAYRDGVGFQSAKGLKAISRGLQVGDLGDPVSDRIGFIGSTANVVDAIHVDDQNQIRFYTDYTDGTIWQDESLYYCLVYDYALNEWFEWTFQSNRAAAKVGPHVYQATSTIVVAKESTSLYTDRTDVPIVMELITSWFSWASVTGFYRLYGIQLIGSYRSEHRVEADIYYDFDETPIVQSLEKIMSLDADQEWRLDIPPKRQRCSSVKISFRDNTESLTAVGTITCVPKANMIDGETVTIGDGSTTTVFEFDVQGDGVEPGNAQVDISSDTTAAEVADTLLAAISATSLGITSSAAAEVISLTHEDVGAIGNVTITDTVVDPDFLVTGMHGGQEPGEGFRFSAMGFLVGLKGGTGRLVRGKRLFHAIVGGAPVE